MYTILSPIEMLILAAVILVPLAIVWGVRAVIRHPVKMFATVASLLGLLVLLGVIALVAAKGLPAWSRDRHVAASAGPVSEVRREVQTAVREAQEAMHEAQAAVREAEAAVRYDASPASVEACLSGERRREPMAPMRHRLFMAAAILGLVVLGYCFLDAGRRGWLKWPLRIGATAGFVALCVMTLRLYETGTVNVSATWANRAEKAPAVNPAVPTKGFPTSETGLRFHVPPESGGPDEPVDVKVPPKGVRAYTSPSPSKGEGGGEGDSPPSR